MKQEGKIWIDHNGQKVPKKYVKNIDKKTELIVHRHLKKAKDLQQRMAKFKQEFIKDVDELYLMMLNEAGIKKSQRKGNFTFFAFDKSVKIETSISNHIKFDENIELAQIKMNEYLNLKLKDADEDIATIVNSAFKTNKKQLDTKRVLGLFRLKINHRLWDEAIELIKKSMYVNKTKRYFKIFERKTDDETYENINLNFSNI